MGDSLFEKIKMFLSYRWVQDWIILVIILIPITLVCLKITPQVNKSTLDIINLLVQSEAAVMAIVITLSLVAVQLAASAYSTRVMEIFRSSLSFWAVVILYLSSITFGIATLILAETGIDSFFIKNFILLNYYLGFISFISLIPFIWINFDLLNISTVINRLVLRITKDKLLNEIYLNENKNNDSLQPVIDIIQASLTKNDYETIRYGLTQLDNQINPIIEEGGLNKEQINEIIRYLFLKFKRVFYLAINRKDEDSAIEILTMLLKNGIFNPKWNYDKKISLLTINFIEDIGNFAIDQRMTIFISGIALSLGRVGEMAVENLDLDSFKDTLFVLENISSASIDRSMDASAKTAVTSIVNIEKSILSSDPMIFEPLMLLKSIFDFVERAINKENDSLTVSLLIQFEEAATSGIKNKAAGFPSFPLFYIKELRKRAIRRNLTTSIIYTGICFEKFFESILNYDIETDCVENTMDFARSIADIAEDETDETKLPLIDSFKRIVEKMEEKKYDHPFLVDSINDLNKIMENLEKSISFY